MEKKTTTEKWKLAFETIQAVLSCGAILAGGWWFFHQGTTQPKANCSHKLSIVKVNNGTNTVWWCSLEIKVSNVGQIPLAINESRLKVNLIQPLPDGWNLAVTNGRVSFPKFFYHTNDDLQEYVQPGEDDYNYFEFTLPDYVKTFRVYSSLILGKDHELGWNKVSVFNIKGGIVSEAKIPDE